MRIYALPVYNNNFSTVKYRKNAVQQQINFSALPKINDNVKKEAGVIGAIACLVGIPFLFCMILKNLCSKKNSNEHIFLSDGTYLGTADEFK